MWDLYLTAKTFRVRPSSLLDIEGSYEAYCLDTAVAEFGRVVESELRQVEGKNKKQIASKAERVLRKWLDMPARYRNPQA